MLPGVAIKMTPREIQIVADAYNEDELERWNASVKIAYLNAKLVRAKELPKLEDLIPPPPETRQQKKERLLARMARFKRRADKEDRRKKNG